MTNARITKEDLAGLHLPGHRQPSIQRIYLTREEVVTALGQKLVANNARELAKARRTLTAVIPAVMEVHRRHLRIPQGYILMRSSGGTPLTVWADAQAERVKLGGGFTVELLAEVRAAALAKWEANNP